MARTFSIVVFTVGIVLMLCLFAPSTEGAPAIPCLQLLGLGGAASKDLE